MHEASVVSFLLSFSSSSYIVLGEAQFHDGQIVDCNIDHGFNFLCDCNLCQCLGQSVGGVVRFIFVNTHFMTFSVNSPP
jgi:hypothetical protein